MYKDCIKPLVDKILAMLLITLLLPVYIIIALIIYIELGKPILFTQKRPGRNEKIFTIYKFRTMSDDRDKNGNPLPDEERLYGVGKKIRELSLDELPQLFNVLKGDMSFIGPRPLLVEYLPFYSKEQKKRHNVQPGITGLAQVKGRNALSWEDKFFYDIKYVNNINFLLDLKIAYLTVLKVIKKDGISQKGHVTMAKFSEEKQRDMARFDDWSYPEIIDSKPTKYNWVVQNKNNFTLGYKTDIGAFSYINAAYGVELEDYVQIGSHCSLYSVSTIDNKQGKILLKKNCKIGSHSTILPGVTIGENSIIGAHSLILEDIEDNVIAFGVPAKVIKKINE